MSWVLRIAGWVALVVGAVLIVSGTVADVSTTSPARYDSLLGYSSPSRIVNYSLMFGALRSVLTGGFLALIGAVFLVGGELLTRSRQVEPVASTRIVAAPFAADVGSASAPAAMSPSTAAGRVEGGRFDRAMMLVTITIIAGIAIWALSVMSGADRAAARNPAAEAAPVATTVDSASALADASAEEARIAAGQR